MDPTNPYAPPMADLGPNLARPLFPDETWRARRGRIIWLVLFGLNLIVPGLLADGMLAPGGWVGMASAVAVLGGGGFALLLVRPRWTGMAVAGAATIAATQLLPILQISAGMVGIMLVDAIIGPLGLDKIEALPRNLDLAQAFAVTFATGAGLLAASIVCGSILGAIGRYWRRGSGEIGPGRLHDPAGRV